MNRNERIARKALAEAKAILGGGHALAAAISRTGAKAKVKISPQAVNKWTTVPMRRVLVVERLSGVPRSRLCPHLYPPD